MMISGFSINNALEDVTVDLCVKKDDCLALVTENGSTLFLAERGKSTPSKYPLSPTQKRNHFKTLPGTLDFSIEYDPETRSIIWCHEKAEPVPHLPRSIKTSPSFLEFASHFQEMNRTRASESLEKLTLRHKIDFIIFNGLGLCVVARYCHRVFFHAKEDSALTEHSSGTSLTIQNSNKQLAISHTDFPSFSINGANATLLGKYAHFIHYLPDQLRSGKISDRIFELYISSPK